MLTCTKTKYKHKCLGIRVLHAYAIILLVRGGGNVQTCQEYLLSISITILEKGGWIHAR